VADVRKIDKPSKKVVSTKKGAASSPVAKKSVSRTAARRADFGASIDGFFAKQPPHLRAILEELRSMIQAAAPDAKSSIKWGMPWFTVDGNMMCSLGGHKSHVNLVLVGPAEAFVDPEGRLLGESKGGRHLKLTTLAELPRESVNLWLRTAADLARGKG
jgi:hypothetical protein